MKNVEDDDSNIHKHFNTFSEQREAQSNVVEII